jgi:hypothetical protein
MPSQEILHARALAEAAQLVLEGLEGLAAIDAVCHSLGEALGVDRFLLVEVANGHLGTLYEWIRPASAERGTIAVDLPLREVEGWLTTVAGAAGPAVSRRVAPHAALGSLAQRLHHPRTDLAVDLLAWQALQSRGLDHLHLVAARFAAAAD